MLRTVPVTRFNEWNVKNVSMFQYTKGQQSSKAFIKHTQ